MPFYCFRFFDEISYQLVHYGRTFLLSVVHIYISVLKPFWSLLILTSVSSLDLFLLIFILNVGHVLPFLLMSVKFLLFIISSWWNIVEALDSVISGWRMLTLFWQILFSPVVVSSWNHSAPFTFKLLHFCMNRIIASVHAWFRDQPGIRAGFNYRLGGSPFFSSLIPFFPGSRLSLASCPGNLSLLNQ